MGKRNPGPNAQTNGRGNLTITNRITRVTVLISDANKFYMKAKAIDRGAS